VSNPDQANSNFANEALGTLSAREREVALLAARGLGNKAIARELGVTEGTIKLHLHAIYRKLGIKSRFVLIALVAKSL